MIFLRMLNGGGIRPSEGLESRPVAAFVPARPSPSTAATSTKTLAAATARVVALPILATIIACYNPALAEHSQPMQQGSKPMAGHGQPGMQKGMKEHGQPGMQKGMKEHAQPSMPKGMKMQGEHGMPQGMKEHAQPDMPKGMEMQGQHGMSPGMKNQKPHDMSDMGHHDMTKMGMSVNVHVVHMSGTSRTVAQHIVTEFLLAALGVDTETRIKSILKGRQYCQRILRALRHGDAKLGLHGTKNPKVLLALSEVDELWAQFDAVISDSVEVDKISRGQVSGIADLSEPLLDAMGVMVSTFEAHADGGELFSALSQTVGVAQKQNLLLHKMNELYLLIAYGHDVKRNQARLAKSIADFDLALKALIQGNAKLHVMPAPNAAIELQYNAIRAMWKRHQPSLETAVDTHRIAAATIRRAASRSVRMAEKMDKAVALYHDL